MLITILVIIGLSFLVLAHEAGHFFVSKLFKLKVDEFGFGFPPRLFAKRYGETEYSINLLPFGGFVKIAGENDQLGSDTQTLEQLPVEEKSRYFLFQPVWKRSLIILAGVVVNFVVGWLLLSSVLFVGTPPVVVISDIQPNSPAAAVGIMAGDIAKGYIHTSDFIQYVNEHKGSPIHIQVRRSGQDLDFEVTPRTVVTPDQGALGVVLAEGGSSAHSFSSALGLGFKEAAIISWLTVVGFYDLAKNLLIHASLVAGVVGPVGIFSVAQQTGHIGLIYLVQLISLISINLAVINLLPFPALDGGRFFMILIEKIKGSPIPRRAEAMVNGAGLIFLLFLMLVLTIHDVTKLF